MLLRQDGQTPVAQRSATVDTVYEQFRMAWDLHNTNIKFLHPSKRKRGRLRTRPQALAALKVSSVVKDIRAVQKKSETFEICNVHHLCAGNVLYPRQHVGVVGGGRGSVWRTVADGWRAGGGRSTVFDYCIILIESICMQKL